MENTIEKRITEKGKSYWDSKGAYQKEMDKLYGKLVPSSGEANTVHGEMIRSINRLFYDFCNNGNCNVIEVLTETETDRYTCSECNGSGEVDGEDVHGEDAIETCGECGGSGELVEENEVETGEIEITQYYKKMIDFLSEKLNNKKVVSDLIEFLKNSSKGYGKYAYNDDEMGIYNNLCDEVMFQILTTDNVERKVVYED